MKTWTLSALIFLFSCFCLAYPKVRYSVLPSSSACTGEIQPNGKIKYLGNCNGAKPTKNLVREVQNSVKIPPTKKAKSDTDEPSVIERR